MGTLKKNIMKKEIVEVGYPSSFWDYFPDILVQGFLWMLIILLGYIIYRIIKKYLKN